MFFSGGMRGEFYGHLADQVCFGAPVTCVAEDAAALEVESLKDPPLGEGKVLEGVGLVWREAFAGQERDPTVFVLAGGLGSGPQPETVDVVGW